MSLNWKEIDLVLSELDLVGAKIERVTQPTFDSLSLGLYKGGVTTELFFSIAQGASRLHALSAAPPKPTRPLRFMECMRSRVRGGRIDSIAQIGDERVVKVELSVPRTSEDKDRADDGVEIRRFALYARLWSGAGNLVLVDDQGIVVDALARRPKKGEVSGERCTIEEGLSLARASRETKAGPTAEPQAGGRDFQVRDLPGEGSFNQRVEAHYSERVGELSRDKLLEAAREKYGRKARSLESRIVELTVKAEEFRESERLRELGDILMANQDAVDDGASVVCDDFYRGGSVVIPVESRQSIVENANGYYDRYRKAKTGLAGLEGELSGLKFSLSKLSSELSELEAEQRPLMIARALSKGGTSRPAAGASAQRRAYPGLSLEVAGWTLLIGRSAKENDELLRKHVRGSDLWLHARDWPGSYVFIKGRRDKSVPLEVLLDAGMLAIYYSKGRASGGGDLYYTFAKYLRRAKDGPKGLVLPTHEKNLRVKLDEARVKELRSLIGEDDSG